MSNWTGGLRRRLNTELPIEHILPDQQPAYVRSAVYLFGAITIASLVVVVISGIILAFFGPQWWHTSAVGHWFNSLHFWSVQSFFFFMVLHLWGSFFMGAWRDGRGRTWVTGAIAFAVSIGTAFTGYLSQSNFDSQWIGVSAKDAINSVGIGSFFNVLNFGQMYSFHIFLLPAAIAAIIVGHIILVRLRGVVRPYPAKGEQAAAYSHGMTQETYYRGIKMVPYDLIREVTVLLGVVTLVVIVFASVLSSPDIKPLTIQSVASSDPVGFVTVALTELDGSSGLAQYGPPYNTGTSSVQSIGPVSLQKLAGVHINIDTAQSYVLQPLGTIQNATVQAAMQAFKAASADQQAKWEAAYSTALQDPSAAVDPSGNLTVPTGDYGPLPVMFDGLLQIARSGALDGLLLSDGQFYQTNYTKPLLFLNENALPNQAQSLNLLGSQWGMMNETDYYPGQAWLWLYTFWYQLPFGPFNGPNADVAVLLTMAVLTTIMIFFPYIPRANQLPRYLGVHRLIWRDHYRSVEQSLAKAPSK